MKIRRLDEWMLGSLKVGLLGASACILLSSQPAAAEEAGAKAVVDAPNQGMTVQVDPATGKIIPGTPQNLPPLSSVERNSLSTSHDGLQEVPSPGPAGGYKLDLKGRFQSPLMATVGPDGKVVVQHLDEGNAPGHHKHNQ